MSDNLMTIDEYLTEKTYLAYKNLAENWLLERAMVALKLKIAVQKGQAPEIAILEAETAQIDRSWGAVVAPTIIKGLEKTFAPDPVEQLLAA